MSAVGNVVRQIARHTVHPCVRVAAAILALGIAACAGPSTKMRAPHTLTVVTLNLWHDKADWPARQVHIATTLRALHPDVIVLQEVLQHAQLPNQAQTLADALGYRHAFASVDAPDAVRRYGNAILTPHRILADEARPLQPADDYRIALHARIALDDGTPFDVYATHLHHTPEGTGIRRQQVDDLLDFIDATSGGIASIVAGDFNTPADAPEVSALTARYRDAYDATHPDAAQDDPRHSTLNLALYAPLRIDHVLFDPAALAVRDARRLFDTPMPDGAWASDHFGVVATLRLTAPRVPASRE